jgi:caa(3)-type oxidase subunit IV
MASEIGKKIDEIDSKHETSELRSHEGLRRYYVIFAWLMGLLVATVIASWIPFDRLMPGLSAIIALAIAAVKGSLVVLFFMHVKDASKLTWAFATAALLWLGIMFTYTFSDYATRRSLPDTPDQTPPAIRARAAHHNGVAEPHLLSEAHFSVVHVISRAGTGASERLPRFPGIPSAASE